jgi:cyanate lyase
MNSKKVRSKIIKEILKKKERDGLSFTTIGDLNEVRRQTVTAILQGTDEASLEKVMSIAESLRIHFEIKMINDEGKESHIYGKVNK